MDVFRDPESEQAAVRHARYCLTLLSRRRRSEAELRRALTERTEQDHALVDEVIARLKRSGLIDDAAFAEDWVEQRREHKLLGTAALRSELENKGVHTAVINEVLDSLEDADIGESARCRELVQQRLAKELASTQRRNRERPALARRLLAMLGRRGYSQNLSLRVVNEELDAAGVTWPGPPGRF